MVDFKEVYTTSKKIAVDTKNVEKEKTIISDDAFSIGDTISDLIKQIEKVRLNFLK